MLVDRREQYKAAAIKAKQAGNDELAIKHIRTAKVTHLCYFCLLCTPCLKKTSKIVFVITLSNFHQL